MRASSSSLRHYECLNGLRGVAALLIAAMHVAEYFQVPWAPAHAYLAVDFFFMLSGFVIAHAYDQRLRTGLTLFDFCKIRIARLYPLIILGVALGGLAWFARHVLLNDVGISHILAAMAMNSVLLPTSALLGATPWAFPINSPLWSLSAEMLINFIYALAFRLLTTRRLIACALAAVAALVWLTWRVGTLNVGFAWADVPEGLSRVFYPFFVGVILLRTSPGGTVLRPWGHAAVLGLVLVLAVPIGPVALTDFVSVVFVFPLIIAVAARASAHRRLDALWRRLGRLSYPLYMVHFPCVVVLSNLAHRRGVTGWRLEASAVLCFLAVVAFAGAVEVIYDEPARRALKSVLARKRDGHEAASPAHAPHPHLSGSRAVPVET